MQVERLTDSECYELVYWLPRRVSRPSTGRYWLAADLEQRAVGIWYCTSLLGDWTSSVRLPLKRWLHSSKTRKSFNLALEMVRV